MPQNPRAALVEHLTADMRAALAAGDLQAARVAHDALGRLLGPADRHGSEAAAGGTVVDIAAGRPRV